MAFNAREAADRLLEIADHIERQAAASSFFVCDGCNDVTSLSDINGARNKYASEHNIDHVSTVSIHDVVACSSCGGDMKYAATEGSEKYFVTASKEDEDEEFNFDSLEESEDAESKEDSGADTGEESGDSDQKYENPEDDTSEDGNNDNTDDNVDDSADDIDLSEDDEKVESTPKEKKTTESDVDLKKAPEQVFGDEDKKTRAKTAFEKAVSRYSI